MTHPPTEQARKQLYATATALLTAERTGDRRKPSEGRESSCEKEVEAVREILKKYRYL